MWVVSSELLPHLTRWTRRHCESILRRECPNVGRHDDCGDDYGDEIFVALMRFRPLTWSMDSGRSGDDAG